MIVAREATKPSSQPVFLGLASAANSRTDSSNPILNPKGFLDVLGLEVGKHLADIELRLPVFGAIVDAYFGVVTIGDRLLETQQLLLL